MGRFLKTICFFSFLSGEFWPCVEAKGEKRGQREEEALSREPGEGVGGRKSPGRRRQEHLEQLY